QFALCQPNEVSQSCLEADKSYSIRIVAFLGPLPYSSEISTSAIFDPTKYVTSLIATSTQSSITVSWDPPATVTDTPVLFYRVMLKYAISSNGYKTTRPDLLDLPTELIGSVTSTRLE
ncbi:MAG: hypothetical protein ACK53Y_13260, partial [bacterium]